MEGGDVKQRLDLQRGVGSVVQAVERFVESTGDEFVEGRVCIVVHLAGFQGPHGLHGIDAVAVEVDGEVDKVGIFLQDGFDFLFIGVFQMVLLEMDDDGGPAILPHIGGDLADIVRSDAVGIPDEGGLILSPLVGRPGPDLDPVPDHECRIEADAELAK